MLDTQADHIRAQYRHAFRCRTDLNNVLTRWHLKWAGISDEEIDRRHGEYGKQRGYDPLNHFGSKF